MPESQSSPARLLLTAREAAQVLCLSARKLWGLTASGEIPCVRIGRSVRYSARELERWIASRMEQGGRQ